MTQAESSTSSTRVPSPAPQLVFRYDVDEASTQSIQGHLQVVWFKREPGEELADGACQDSLSRVVPAVGSSLFIIIYYQPCHL